jgi:hypothetical protein
MKAILLFSLTLSFVACKVSKDVNEIPPQDTNLMITAILGEFEKNSDPIEIIENRIVGNKLLLTVSYNGGCNEHTFKFIGSTSISKSLPPIRSVQLVHNSNGDLCKKLITETIEIDLKALAYQQQPGSTIFLSIEGIKEQIEYTYK